MRATCRGVLFDHAREIDSLMARYGSGYVPDEKEESRAGRNWIEIDSHSLDVVTSFAGGMHLHDV